MKTKSPIKRHPALVAFSRDHHFGLLLGWKIQQGLKRQIAAERIGRYVQFYFEEDLRQHFKEEEKWLFGSLPKEDKLRMQAESEHEVIYALVEAICNNLQDIDLLNRFANTLEDHIRFEERTLFKHLQEYLNEEDLEKAIAHTGSNGPALDAKWTDNFWEVNK